MGKSYDHCYHLADPNSNRIVGEMVCCHCQKDILPKTDDWVNWTKQAKHDWYYVTAHRRCAQDDAPWVAIEKNNAAAKARNDAILSALKSVAEQYEITDGIGLAEYAAEALGDDLDDIRGYY